MLTIQYVYKLRQNIVITLSGSITRIHDHRIDGSDPVVLIHLPIGTRLPTQQIIMAYYIAYTGYAAIGI